MAADSLPKTCGYRTATEKTPPHNPLKVSFYGGRIISLVYVSNTRPLKCFGRVGPATWALSQGRPPPLLPAGLPMTSLAPGDPTSAPQATKAKGPCVLFMGTITIPPFKARTLWARHLVDRNPSYGEERTCILQITSLSLP